METPPLDGPHLGSLPYEDTRLKRRTAVPSAQQGSTGLGHPNGGDQWIIIDAGRIAGIVHGQPCSAGLTFAASLSRRQRYS